MRLAQVPLEDLDGTRFRQRFGAELAGTRDLVAGDVGSTVVDQLLLAQRVARAGHPHGVDALTPAVVGHTDDRRLEHAGVFVEGVLTSVEYTFSPNDTIMSFTRSTRNR